MNDIHRKSGSTTYTVKGRKPKLLFLSGMHGDESEVIDVVSSYINRHFQMLPDFLYIPQVSPSAVELGTRENNLGNDINRSFFADSGDKEVQDIISILSPNKFDLCLDFHEDPELTKRFYIYDSSIMEKNELHTFRRHFFSRNIHLYSGIDDATDDTLGYTVKEGYISFHKELDAAENAGFSSEYLIHGGIVKRMFTFEIPGKAPITLKRHIVFTTIRFFLSYLT